MAENKDKIKMYYLQELDIMAIVEPTGKIYKFIGSLAPADYQMFFIINTWYEATIPPTAFKDYKLIGKL